MKTWEVCPTCLKRLVATDGRLPLHGRYDRTRALIRCPLAGVQVIHQWEDDVQLNIEGTR